ncbi:adenylate/guanylate cyclase domain-containing protein [Gloeothece verrucosa]|nr:adenylate/guanylate cyclase domain-containing protein [Gloeothece verrucosa]
MLLLISIALIFITGYMDYSSGKTAFTKTIFNQLVILRSVRAKEIESYFQFSKNQILTVSESPSAIEAMKTFKAAYQKLETQTLNPNQQQQLEKYYQNVFIPELGHNVVDGTPIAETYLPQTSVAQYLQYHYLAKNRSKQRQNDLENPGDGSEYSKVHQKYHPLFRNLQKRFKYNDIYLIDVDSGNIVYSAEKQVDFATNIGLGPYENTNLAKAILSIEKSRDHSLIIIKDFEPYRPSYNKPSAFIATTIFDGTEFIGALVFQLPIEKINGIMTSSGQWEQTGLGQTGETYLVGPDNLLRSLPRQFVENPNQYYQALEKNGLDNNTIERIRRLNTPILVQKIESSALEQAITGKKGTAIYQDYRGIPVLAAYQPIQVGDFNWGLIAQMSADEAFAPINEFTRQLLVTSAILVVFFTPLSNWLARLFVRPIKQLRAGACRIGSGETDVKLNIQSKDEFGELAVAFNYMSENLHQRELLIQQMKQENENLLLNILPDLIAKRYKKGEQAIADTFPNVTVLYAEIEGFNELSAELPPEQTIRLLNEIVSAFDEAAEAYGVEKMRTIGNLYVAVCGLSVARVDHVKRTVDFALDLLKLITRFNQQQGTKLSLDIGIHCGPVVGGIVGKTRFIYALTGETMRIAYAIHSSPRQNVIQVTHKVYESVKDLYPFEQIGEVEIPKAGVIPIWSMKIGGIKSSINVNSSLNGASVGIID